MADRSTAPKVLGISLTVFTTLYITIIILAGPNPPAFLFDAIQGYWNRRLAGLLLWIHVVVSYAINSQAICSSMDRLFWYRLFNRNNRIGNFSNSATATNNERSDDDDENRNKNITVNRMSPERQATIRWMSLTALMGITAYTVANAIPFFEDLVALIGAVTVVPLTLLLPALYWRKELQVPLFRLSSGGGSGWSWWCWCCGSWSSLRRGRVDWPSYTLLVYSVIFMVTATAGVLDSISQDWKNHSGKPFECRGK